MGELLSAFNNNLQDSIKATSNNYLTIKKQKDNIKVTIKDSLLATKGGLWLLGHCRSVPFYFAKVSPQKVLVFPIKDFIQDGIHSFLLLDSDLNKIDEQQCFINQKREFCNLSVSLDSTSQATKWFPIMHYHCSRNSIPTETIGCCYSLCESLPEENRDGVF